MVDLYPVIPQDQGVEIIRRFFDKRDDQLVSLESICKLANIELKHNWFKLGKDVYHQILATAIGKKFAQHYVSLWLVWKKRYLKISLSTLCLLAVFGWNILHMGQKT